LTYPTGTLISISVIVHSLTGDAIQPEFGTTLEQDYALAAYNIH